jgi:single-strand DNA-binding protein
MRGVNKAIILGRVGHDPEVKYLPDGRAVTTFSVATSESWKDKNTGEAKENTEWHLCVAFSPLADKVIGPYVSKGDPIFIEGQIKTRKWQGKDGQGRYTTEIVVRNVQLLGQKKKQQQPQRPQQRPTPDYQEPFNDNIPFGDSFDETMPF